MKTSMELAEIVAALNLKPVGGAALAKQVTGVYCSDLLSDVMAAAQAGSILVTILTHENVVAVAALLDLAAVLFTCGKQPGAETVRRAEENGVPLLLTGMSTFETAGKLYQLLAARGSDHESGRC